MRKKDRLKENVTFLKKTEKKTEFQKKIVKKISEKSCESVGKFSNQISTKLLQKNY
jgi:hypothetical protein